jgi:hypothetical protein
LSRLPLAYLTLASNQENQSGSVTHTYTLALEVFIPYAVSRLERVDQSAIPGREKDRSENTPTEEREGEKATLDLQLTSKAHSKQRPLP